MKERLPVSLDVYVVIKDGILRGNITQAMKRGRYSVKTFLGNVTVAETRLFKMSDFVKACELYQNMFGEK